MRRYRTLPPLGQLGELEFWKPRENLKTALLGDTQAVLIQHAYARLRGQIGVLHLLHPMWLAQDGLPIQVRLGPERHAGSTLPGCLSLQGTSSLNIVSSARESSDAVVFSKLGERGPQRLVRPASELR